MDYYAHLTYAQYKSLEHQLRQFQERETSHTSVEGFYHKSIRIMVGCDTWEFHGPMIKAANPHSPPQKASCDQT